MRYFLYILSLLITFVACSPSLEIAIKPYDQEKDLPRYCFTERMFFYEVSEKDEALQLWIYSKNRLTVDQLISQPFNIYFSEKKKKKIKYQIKYKDLANNKLKDRSEPEVQLSFLKYTETDTINVTADYQFNIKTDYNGSRYNLTIEFPKEIFSEFEEPVLGIYSKTPEPFQKKGSNKNNQTSEEAYKRQNNSRAPEGQPSHQFIKEIKEIDLWFKVIFQ
jgi:hypothetical protein